MPERPPEILPSNSILVGREEPLRTLGHLLDLASSGSGAAALITGDAGVGKTFLARQLAERARGALSVAWAACSEQDTSPANAPWPEIVAQMLEVASAANLPAPLRDDLQEIADGKSLAELTGQNLMTAGFGASRAIAALTRACGPTLLVLDDLHWADHTSLAVLERLLRVAAELPLLIVATARESEIWTSGPRRPVFQRLLRNVLPIALDPFTYDEAQQLLAALGRPTSATTVHRLMTLTAGNPFLLSDLLRREISSDFAGHAGPSLGGKLFLDARLDGIPLETQSLLTTLAILGREVPLERLQGHFAGKTILLRQTLDAAVADRLLVTLPGITLRYSFSNDLLREAMLARIPRAEQERLHLQAAQQLGSEDEEPAPGASSIEIARHLREALPISETMQLERWARRAGAAAQASGDPIEAADWFQTAIDCHGEQASACPTDLLLDFARARTDAGDRGQGMAICATLIERARAAGDFNLLAQAALAMVPSHSLDGSVRWGDMDLLAEALGAIDGANTKLSSSLRARTSTLLSFSSDSRRCRALANAAVAEARRLGDLVHLRSVLPALRLALWGPDDVPAQERLSAEMIELASAAPRSAALVNQARIWKAADALGAGSQADYASNLQAWQTEAGAGLHPTRLGALRLAEGTRDIMMARLDTADARLTATEFELEGILDGNTTIREQSFLVQRLGILREWQRTVERETEVAVMAGRVPVTSLWRPIHALLHLDEGRLDEAREGLALVHATGFAGRPRNGTWLGTLAAWAEVAAALGAYAAAAELHDLLAPHARQHVVAISGADCWGSVHRFLGLLENTLGRPQDARASFEKALVADMGSGNLLRAAHDRVLLAQALRQEGSPAQERRAERMLLECTEFGRVHTLPRLIGLIALAEAARGPTAAARLTPIAADSPARSEERTVSLRRTGATWQIAFRGQGGVVRDSRGMSQILRLLQTSGVSHLALDLFRQTMPTTGTGQGSRAREGLGEDSSPSFDPMLDDRARANLRQRIRDLGADLAACEESADLGRTEALRTEREILVGQLARSLGLGGRTRGMASADERARVNVTRTIRSALRDIAVVSPVLGVHLQRQITTGRLCCYDPDPVSPLEFDLD